MSKPNPSTGNDHPMVQVMKGTKSEMFQDLDEKHWFYVSEHEKALPKTEGEKTCVKYNFSTC